MDVVLEARNLTKKFKNIIAVNNLSLKVFKGDIFGFLGPNGSGKNATIRMFTSLIYPDSGEIFLFNEKLTANNKSILRRVGAIVESPDFYLYLTAYKNLEILARMYGISPTRNEIMEILEFVGLAQRWNSKVKTFSHGMKQRLGIAQALLHNPDLIILDEPTTGLDPQGMKEIRELVISLSKEKGKTIFISSHLLYEIEMIANRMIIINKGQKVIEGNVKDLLNSENSIYIFKVTDLIKAQLILGNLGFAKGEDFEIIDNEIKILTKKISPAKLNKIFVQNEIEVHSFYPQKSLEQFFLEITQGQK